MPHAVVEIEINGSCKRSSFSVFGKCSASDTYLEPQHLYIAVVHMAPLELGHLVSEHKGIEGPWMCMVGIAQPRPGNHAYMLSLCSYLVGYSYSLHTRVWRRKSGSKRIEYY